MKALFFRRKLHTAYLNDPAAVVRERANGNPNPLAPEVSFRETSSARFEAPWAFEGNHTVVVRVFYRGRLRDTYSYEQEVIDARSNAIDVLNKETAPGLQPDVYIAQLQLAKQIATSQGVEERETQKIANAIANAEEKLGITEDNPTGEAEPITVTLISTAQPNPVPLQLYLKPEANGVWAIVDLTDPGNARTYRGRGNRSAESTTMSAITHAWENFVARNPHPEGQIAAKINHSQTGANVPLIRNDHSDGISELGKIGQWFSRVGLVAGIGAIALTVAPVPGSRVAAGLLIVSGASAAAAGGLNIADRLQHGNFEWDGETALDLVDIAAGLAVGVGTAVQLGGKAASIARLRNTVLISEGIETGSDVASGVILSALHYRRIEEIRNSNLPEEQKQAQIEQELSVAAANGGLILLGTVGIGRRQRNRDFEFSPDGITALNRGTRNSDELNQWRRIGLNEQEIAQLNDPNIARADKDALIASSNQVYKELYGQFNAEGLSILNQRLGVDGFNKIHQASGNDGLQTVIDVIELENQGRIRNFDDWISFFKRSNAENANLADVIGELSVAKQTTLELRQGKVINVGGDERSLAQSRDPEKSFDLTVENQQTGEVLRNIEVETVRGIVYEVGELESGVGHAASKAVKDTSGTVEAAIRIDLPEPGEMKITRQGKRRYFGSNGRYVDIDPETKTTDRIGRDTYAGEKSIFEGLRQRLSKTSDFDKVDRVTVFDKNGTTIAILRKQMGGTWKLENVR